MWSIDHTTTLETTMSHTPEPWEFFHRWDSEGNMTLAEVYRKTGERLFGVEQYDTIVRAPYWRTKEDHAQALEDIRLCAAAPDLLAALEDCITDDNAGCIVRNDVAYMIRRFKAINEIARAAINKAKGIK
jgi:hypothetical protein